MPRVLYWIYMHRARGRGHINPILHDITNIYRDGATQLLRNALNAHAQYHV